MTQTKAAYTREHKLAVLDRFYASEMSQKAFAAKEGVPFTSFNFWVREDKSKWRPKTAGRVPVAPDAKVKAGGSETSLPKAEPFYHEELGDKEWVAAREINNLRASLHTANLEHDRLMTEMHEKVEALQKVILVLGHQL